jgi:hypothetical protein
MRLLTLIFAVGLITTAQARKVEITWKGDYVHNGETVWSPENGYHASGLKKNFMNGAPEEHGKVQRGGVLEAEGVFGHERCLRLNVPENMKILRLPDIDSLRQLKTIGPGGEHISDVNGKAAAIECYLDFDSDGCVKWNNYNDGAKTYQGELIGKDRYKNQFLGQKSREIGYDYSKIESVLDLIVANCVAISEARQIEYLETQF